MIGGLRRIMQYCEGFGDWVKCLRCEHLSTLKCPLEEESVVEGLRLRMLAEGNMPFGFNDRIKGFDK